MLSRRLPFSNKSDDAHVTVHPMAYISCFRVLDFHRYSMSVRLACNMKQASVQSFKIHLKTFLFSRAYNSDTNTINVVYKL